MGTKVKGSIVNVSSQASMVGLKEHASYCTSKGALDQLTRVMALELGPHGIRTNCVNPTVVLTALGRAAWSDPAKVCVKSSVFEGQFVVVLCVHFCIFKWGYMHNVCASFESKVSKGTDLSDFKAAF